MTDDKKNSYLKLWDTLKRFLTLKTEDIKLTMAEKATIVVSTLVVCTVITILAACMLFFLTIAAAQWIGESLGLSWAYLIIGGAYAILITFVAILRKQLIIDPVSKFITRVILS